MALNRLRAMSDSMRVVSPGVIGKEGENRSHVPYIDIFVEYGLLFRPTDWKESGRTPCKSYKTPQYTSRHDSKSERLSSHSYDTYLFAWPAYHFFSLVAATHISCSFVQTRGSALRT